MSENQSSYRQILKATSLFGGVQVITILISIVRTKFVAVWLGAAGVGIIGLLNSPIAIITTLTGLGLSFGAVRDISAAAATGDDLQVAKTVKTFRRWVWLTGSVGMCLTIFLARFLSEWSFGNSNYTWAFIALSCTLLLNDISSGQNVLLRGMRKLNYMAQSTIIGAVIGLFTSLPLYYFYGIKGIVPSLIITAFSSLFLSWLFSRKIKIEPVEIAYKTSWTDGMSMVKLGIVLTLSGLIGTLIRYLISSYIGRTGGVEQVGLYQSGNGLITGYISIVFTAMGTDYFPRLAGTRNNQESNELVNQQIEMALLIIAPICIGLTIALPLVIKLLYSASFLTTVSMVEWILISVIVKAIVWAIGFLYLAKSDYTTAFKVDNITNFFLLTGYIGMYALLGLEGLGIAEFLLYCFAFILTYYFANKKYQFAFTKQTIVIIVTSLFMSIAVFAILRVMERTFTAYCISIVLLLITSFFSIKNLNKRLDIKSMVLRFIKRK